MNKEDLENIILNNSILIKLEPGDILMFNLKKELPEEIIQKLLTSLKDSFPNNKVIINSPDAQFNVLRPSKEENKDE